MIFKSFITTILLGLVVATVPAPAQAAETGWAYVATAGGTQVKALDATVTSDLTSQSGVTGGPAGRSNDNTVASAQVTGLLTTGVITTSSSSTAVPGGVRVNNTAQTAGLNLLGGLITADAVRTTASTTGAGSTTSHTGGTEFVNLKIAGVNLPLNIPKNYWVEIPGVAQVSLNGVLSHEADGTRGTQAWALGVVLLKPRGSSAAGARIYVNPIFQMVTPVPPSEGAKLGGGAYGTRITATVDGVAKVTSGPTAMALTPYSSSNGKTITNNTAAVNVPGVLTTAAVGSTSTSSLSGQTDASIVNVNELARVNLLGGIITADAIKVTAKATQVNEVHRSDLSMELVNLRIAGQSIPINVSPNTKIQVAGLGEVVVNEQIKYGKVGIIRGLRVTLDTAQAGLPVGANIEIAVASTQVG